MANTKSAKKRAAQALRRRDRNRAYRSRMRTAVKKARTALAAGEENAPQLLAEAIRVVDRTAQKGVVHKNTAARTKSRLAKIAR